MASNPKPSYTEAEYQMAAQAYSSGTREQLPGLTDQQLARLQHITQRVEAIADEIYEFQAEVEQWSRWSVPDWNEPAEWGELRVEREVRELVLSLSAGTWDEIRDAVRDLQVTRGLPGFGDWWESRVLRLQTPKEFEERLWEELCDDDDDRELGDVPDSEIPRRPRFIAVEEAMKGADRELVRIFDELAAVGGPTIDRIKALPDLGITEEQLRARAGSVVAALIESGWRP